ncbi:ubiquitin-activating enzyme E1 1-like isoform X1 [Hibiscus syriacus]|uniref:ubiquitin-activating enzyme E1 1-like isoform X1 n=1 Tax=Hibiscus syriacus TaxID=106335 RepID=UPI001920FB56|nr:ubiquitin-activating enzyme E1 1-like isoform X1 [Hibiscus syriacus]
MLPRKRTASDEVMVIEADSETSSNTNHKGASASSFKKHRLDSCSITAVDNESMTKNGANSVIIGGNGDQSTGRIVESSPSTLNLGDVNHAEIDEDLRSRQLAVYGRETMRRVFASNILVSWMQGLCDEIAKNLILAGVKSVTLHDEGSVELWDLSSIFVFSESEKQQEQQQQQEQEQDQDQDQEQEQQQPQP